MNNNRTLSIPEQMANAIEVLADRTMTELRREAAGYIAYGDQPPTNTEIKWATKDLTRGQLIGLIVRGRFGLTGE